MAKFVLKDAKVYLEGRDISGELNAISFEFSVDTPDSTTFGETTRRRLPGVLDIVANHSGYWDSISATDSADKDFFDQIGQAASVIMSVSPDGGQIGEVAFSFVGRTATYSPGASHGEVLAFQLTVNGDGPFVKGKVFENQAFTTTLTGTIRQLDIVNAEEVIHSIVHVTAISGTATPTVAITVHSDTEEDFPSATLRFTHSDITVVKADQLTLNGAISDSYWRYTMTITGTNPSLTIFAMLAIRPDASRVAGNLFIVPSGANLVLTTTVPTVT